MIKEFTKKVENLYSNRGDNTDTYFACKIIGDTLGIAGNVQCQIIEKVIENLKDEMHLDKNGAIIKDMHNLQVALSRMDYEFGHNLFTSMPTIDREDMDDKKLLLMNDEIFKNFEFKFGKTTTDDEIRTKCYYNEYHPVIEYLDSLVWDNVPRIEKMFIKYGGAEDSELHREYTKLIMVAAVRRVKDPGCKFDTMLILEGKQGISKSSMLFELAKNGDEWFCDSVNLADTTKELIESIEGRWIIEIPELDGMNKANVNCLKSMLSKRSDRARKAYGRYTSTLPRQSIFIGTTNEANYFRDLTGNRRYAPIELTEEINLAEFRKDVDQFWAEAVIMEKNYGDLWIPKHLWAVAEKEQDKRLSIDPWQEKLEPVLSSINEVKYMQKQYGKLSTQ